MQENLPQNGSMFVIQDLKQMRLYKDHYENKLRALASMQYIDIQRKVDLVSLANACQINVKILLKLVWKQL